ncbi:unnamed protein product [Chondrus crispus]|uniref:monodehydroascorbate reductase (NADH) n=1 Tax=Chondrus crispus TaxID=2769 RepID=R7QP71_CHOCR|nr:unnamed protein product [Chondrus crispus]CDF39889.1 unnamed protein product [Chondrus crispus]|eukprot:XP_005710183.1 unnamed protein product [Chondrus crispus]
MWLAFLHPLPIHRTPSSAPLLLRRSALPTHYRAPPLYRRPLRTCITSAMSTYKYVVVGAGNAAGYAAAQFVNSGESDVCLIGEEPVAPYERPALSKAVLMKAAVRLPGFHTCVGGGGDRQAPEWYAEKGVKLMLGSKVSAVDVAEKIATLEDGSTVQASEAMILATGAAPIQLSKTPGHDLKGVHYLRDNSDALELYDALQANIGKTVIVVGGGYIGMEVAAAALTVGCKVTMVFPEEHIMPRLFTADIAKHYEKAYIDKGATLVKNGRLCKAFLGDDEGKIRGVMTCQGGGNEEEIEGSLVVVGVGARVNTDMFKDKLNMDERGGIIVDGNLETSAKGVHAIGDIATFPLKMYNDRPARMEHVQNARETGRHAVDAILKKAAGPYDYLPYFYSRVFDLSWKFYGDSAGDCYVVGDFAPKLLAVWVTDGNVNGIFMEAASDEETEEMKKVAREGCKVDVAAFQKCSSTDEAWALLK